MNKKNLDLKAALFTLAQLQQTLDQLSRAPHPAAHRQFNRHLISGALPERSIADQHSNKPRL